MERQKIAMKIEGDWSTGSYKCTCNRREVPEGYDMFYYKDKDNKCITHIFDL